MFAMFDHCDLSKFFVAFTLCLGVLITVMSCAVTCVCVSLCGWRANSPSRLVLSVKEVQQGFAAGVCCVRVRIFCTGHRSELTGVGVGPSCVHVCAQILHVLVLGLCHQ
jgi:hypothetical protein